MRSMTREQIAARYAKGYGQGQGVAYQPWLQAHDVPSKGVTYRMNGRKTRRMQVLFSTIERNAFLAAQRLDHVVDIREQFPLTPLEETEAIAADLGIDHPMPPKGGFMLMTTDLLLTTAAGALEAISVKPAADLADSRIVEKLEIESIYWQRRDVPWHIVTERELPEGLASNLAWIDDCYEITQETLDPQQIPWTEGYLFDRLAVADAIPLNRVCAEVDDRLGLKSGINLVVFRHALARKHWHLPLAREVDPGAPLTMAPILAAAHGARLTLAA